MVNLIKDYSCKGYMAIECSGGFMRMYSNKGKKFFLLMMVLKQQKS